jgi:hypothetical protein
MVRIVHKICQLKNLRIFKNYYSLCIYDQLQSCLYFSCQRKHMMVSPPARGEGGVSIFSWMFYKHKVLYCIRCRDGATLNYASLDDASLGLCIPRMMCP